MDYKVIKKKDEVKQRGRPKKETTMERFNLYLPSDMLNDLRELAKINKTDVAEIIRKAISEKLKGE